MSSDSSGLTDGVSAELNPTAGGARREQQPAPIPGRPADGASKDAWVRYVVTLGADEAFLTAGTEHFDGERYAVEPAFTRPQLIELANRLGG